MHTALALLEQQQECSARARNLRAAFKLARQCPQKGLGVGGAELQHSRVRVFRQLLQAQEPGLHHTGSAGRKDDVKDGLGGWRCGLDGFVGTLERPLGLRT